MERLRPAEFACVLVCLACVTLMGCGQRYSVALAMCPGEELQVLFSGHAVGRDLEVRIDNEGPNEVMIWFASSASMEVTLEAEGYVVKDVPDREAITIEAGGESGATVRLRADRAAGVSITRMPSPTD